MNTKILLASVGAVLCLSSTPLRADWSADMEIHARQGDTAREQKGKAYGKTQKIRFEVAMQGQKTTIVADMKKKKAWLSMGSTTVAFNMDEMAVKVPNCDSGDIDACLVSNGFKRVGLEAANGHPCAIYEKKENDVTLRLWRPTDLKDAPMARQLTIKNGAEQNRVEFTNIKTAKVKDALFAEPKGAQALDMTSLQAEAMKDPEAFKLKMMEMQKKK